MNVLHISLTTSGDLTVEIAFKVTVRPSTFNAFHMGNLISEIERLQQYALPPVEPLSIVEPQDDDLEDEAFVPPAEVSTKRRKWTQNLSAEERERRSQCMKEYWRKKKEQQVEGRGR